MDTSTRLPGHGLLSEGHPYEWRRSDEEDAASWHRTARMDWRGHGVCSCGESSPVLETNNARKRWHKAHKDEVRGGRGKRVHRLLVTAPIGLRLDAWAVTATFANWIEGRGPEDRQTWLVTCFDRVSFLAAARVIGVTVEEIEGSDGDERYVMLAGEPGSGWQGDGDRD